MEVAEIKNQIQSKQIKPFYVFAGSEWKIQRIYLEQIAKATGNELKYIDSIADIYSGLKSKSFIQKNYVYVVRDDRDLLTNETLQGQLSNVLRKNILILLLTTLDKRTKFYKTYKDIIIEFEPLKPAILKKYIQSQISLSDRNTEKLMEVCEYDYGRCLLEIDKIKQFQVGYGKDKQEVKPYDGCFLQLLNAGVIYQPPKDAIFDFVDAILDREANLSYNLYRQCLGVGEAVMVMLTVLYNNAKALLQVQSCTSRDVYKSTGLNQYQVFGAKKHLNRYRDGELVHLMKICQKCQQGIVTGSMDEEFVMDYILTEVL